MIATIGLTGIPRSAVLAPRRQRNRAVSWMVGTPVSKKRKYIVLDDYVMGGIWMIIKARSESEIKDLNPELIVYKCAPEFLS
jgi:hypothetical protein